MKKPLFAAALLAASITQVQAAPIAKAFVDNAPAKSAVTITFSGYCSGKITTSIAKIEAGAYDDHANNQYSYVRAFTTDIGGMRLANVFYSQGERENTSIAIKKGMLNVKLNSTSTFSTTADSQFKYLLTSGATSQILCKNGQTLTDTINAYEGGSKALLVIGDNTLSQKANFTLKGKEAPFNYQYSQKITGNILFQPAICNIAGDYTGNIAESTYQSSCKAVPVKFTISATAKGQAN
ncbi:MAG: hypothetical protein IT470_04160 [Pseudomonadales bacterium]|nr:hypothetical protein [Pseudomonadales bacterium]